MYDLIIVGGGPAGMNAGIYAARRKLDVLLVTEEFGGQVKDSSSVENYLGFKSETGPQLANKFEEHLKEYDIEVKEDVTIKDVELANEKVKVISEDETFEGRTSLIATGSSKKKLNVPGEEKYNNKGITYCAICDGPFFTDKDVAVIGGGYSGTESALYMSKVANKVYLLEMQESLYGEQITIDEVKSKDNIEVMTETMVTEITGDKMVNGLKYKDLKTDQIENLNTEGIIIEIGLKPNSGIVDVEKDDANHIVVDEKMQTSKKRIYAAGDVTDKGVQQICVSSAQGCIAALEIDKFLNCN